MDFKTSLVTCLSEKFATCKGRASRSEYWYFVLFYTLLSLAVTLTVFILPEAIFLTLNAAVSFGLIVPCFTVSVRRLHDTNKSAWFLLLLFIPVINLVLLYFFIKKSDAGSNRFGENPLGELEQ